MSTNRRSATTLIPRRAVLLSSALGAAHAVHDRLVEPAMGAPSLTDWINSTGRPVAGTDPSLGSADLRPLRSIVGTARVVGLGESAHGTHDQLALKHRVVRYLIERLGFRTLAWEDAWGAGVTVDRYITAGLGDPRQIVRDCGFNLQNEAMVDLIQWLREFNIGRSHRDQVRFVGADVVQVRDLQFRELLEHVATVEPGLLLDLERHLNPLRIQGDPGYHVYWYMTQTAEVQAQLVEHARAVHRLVAGLPNRPSPVSRWEAQMHARALLGFYESWTAEGQARDLRETYIAAILTEWARESGHRVAYSAANAHTATASSQTISFPPDAPRERSMAGGLLRARLGRDYVSVGMTFHHGSLLAGWDTGQPAPVNVPAPHPSFVDHQLGQAQIPDYLIDLRHQSVPMAREWLRSRGTLRVIGGATYDPTEDARYYMAMNRWGDGFDAIFHLRTVHASRLLGGAS